MNRDKKIIYRFFLFIIAFIVTACGAGIYAHLIAEKVPDNIYVQNNKVKKISIYALNDAEVDLYLTDDYVLLNLKTLTMPFL